jgi:phosphatidylglycerophosphate synthase
VTTGSPHSVPSWGNLQRARTYGSFLDAVCDKCYIVPCWIVLLTTVQHSSALKLLQYFVLLWLIVAEVASACVRFQAYFTAPSVAAPTVEGYDFVSSAVKADHIGKAKQTFEMVGTALFVLPWCRYAGLALLMLAVPLAYESVRRKVKKRVVYVVLDAPHAAALDHKTVKFLHQAKGLGSRLVVGIPGTKRTDAVLDACAVSAVDEVVAEAPTIADLMFLERYRVDYVVSLPSQGKLVTDEVVADNRCFVVADDNVARPMLRQPKAPEHKD